MTQYSGRTTAYEHKHGDAWKDNLNAGSDCIIQRTIFDVQWSNCPVEVEDEVKELWRANELGNDMYYYPWDGNEEDVESYPLIAEYLESRGVTNCLIRWWW